MRAKKDTSLIILLLFCCSNLFAQIGTVLSNQKISSVEGNFTGPLSSGDLFGGSVAAIGDLDGDGVTDIVVGAIYDDDGGYNRGGVYILFLDTNGTVKSEQKISDTQGGFTGILGNSDYFGSSVASLGDLDGDGVIDIVVGAIQDDDGGGNRGAVYLLFLDTNGTVKSHQKISDTQGGFTGNIGNSDNFGSSVASLGDLDGDGVIDIVVGTFKDDDGGSNRGAVYVLFLDTNGTVKSHQKISDTQGGFTGNLGNADYFGVSVASLADLDGDGVTDIVVGAYLDDDGGGDRGAVYILFLDTNGTVKSHQKISDTQGEFTGILDWDDRLGASVASLGDIDNDGITDIVVGASRDDDGGGERGSVYILFLDTNGMVKSHQKISDTDGSFNGILDNSDNFGSSVASLEDLNSDGNIDVIVGAVGDDDGGGSNGALWMLSVDSGLQTLPVELMNFTTTTQETSILIEWQTASETNNHHFKIEKSSDGIEFQDIATVMGSGTSYAEHSYSYVDNAPIFGIQYYRLKQIDFNGQYNYYSELAFVNFEYPLKQNLRVFPNPVSKSEKLHIEFDGISNPCCGEAIEFALVSLFDQIGREIFSKEIRSENFPFVLPNYQLINLSPGIYFVVVSYNNQLYKQKLIIQ